MSKIYVHYQGELWTITNLFIRNSLLGSLKQSCPQKRITIQNVSKPRQSKEVHLGQVKFTFEQ
jgi:hypothetical protein